ATDASTGLTRAGQFLGTIDYAAPEQIEGREVDSRADIYAVTCMLHECLTGSRPFPKDSDPAVMNAHLHEPPPRTSELRPGLPTAIDDVIARGMSKAAADRYATCEELMAAARAALDSPGRSARSRATAAAPTVLDVAAPAGAATVTDVGPAGARAPSAPGAPERARRRNRATLIGLAAALVAATAVAILLLQGGPAPVLIRTARSGALSIRYPASWHTASRAEAGAFAIAQPIQLQSGGVTLAAGFLAKSALIPGGTPPQLITRFGAPTSAADALVAGAPGRAYTWTTTTRRLVAYVVATTRADAAVICAAGASGATLQACRKLAARTKLGSSQLLAPGSDVALGATLNSTLGPVSLARSGLRRLTGAFSVRARKATRVAAAESKAAAAIAAITSVPRYSSQLALLAAALRAEQRAFNRLSGAARRSDRSAYSTAVADVKRASAHLAAVRTMFTGLGMRLPALAPLRFAGPPKPVTPAHHTSASSSGASTPVSETTTPASGGSHVSPPASRTTTSTSSQPSSKPQTTTTPHTVTIGP
ncbi:MAG TPA: hypothetical protein VME01_01395, partial [Solirubrobacteraceae bacterium]|nr:hypothetical protein [Solirubrobacteraceae bacterium]